MTALLKTNLGTTPLIGRGKVRDLYVVGDALLMVATDRISAFDHVLGTGIPGKGKILTQISLFWFDLPARRRPKPLVRDRGTGLPCRSAQIFCSARGQVIAGQARRNVPRGVCGARIPCRLRLEGVQGRRNCLRHPAAAGPAGWIAAARTTLYAFDEEPGWDSRREYPVCSRGEGGQGADAAKQLQQLTLAIYARASKHAESRGLILADTKFEFGKTQDGIVLADEVLTPDSSRFWEASAWNPGGPQPSFDKQFVRDYLESIHWNKQAPAPGLPDEVAERTLQKYLEAFRRLTGRNLDIAA